MKNDIRLPASYSLGIIKDAYVLMVSILILCFSFLAVASPNDWMIDKSKDGSMDITHKITYITSAEGDEVPVLQYNVTRIDKLSIDASVALLNDVSAHKKFTGDKVTKVLKDISEDERLIYYFSNSPWPLPDSETVVLMTKHISPDGHKHTFTLQSAPKEIEDNGVARFELYSVVYEFEDLENGEVKISIAARMAPPFKVPKWMMKSALPKAGYDHMEKLVRSIKKEEKD